MRSISKEILIDLLELILEKATLVINRNQSITCAQDFLTSPDRMEKTYTISTGGTSTGTEIDGLYIVSVVCALSASLLARRIRMSKYYFA